MRMNFIDIGVFILFIAVLVYTFLKSQKVMEQAEGKKDSFLTRATFPDKFVHFVCGYALFFALVATFSLDPEYSLALVALGAIGFEMASGKTVKVLDAPGRTREAWHLLDIVAGVAGGALAYASHIT